MYDLGCRGRPMCRPVNSNSRKHQMAKFKAVWINGQTHRSAPTVKNLKGIK